MLVEELRRLRDARALPKRDRLRYLADLASRLRVISQLVGGHEELSALAAELDQAERADADLHALWQRTVSLLESLTGDPTSAGTRPENGKARGQGGSPARRSFWKRP